VATRGSRRDVALLRLAAQRLVGEPEPTAPAAVAWMTALQGQDLAGALTSVALRTAGRTLAEASRSLDDGDVVRTWTMRNTLHLCAAGDVHWLLGLTAARQLAAARRRLDELGIDVAVVSRARTVAEDEIGSDGSASREELTAAWAAAGLDVAGQRAYHLIAHLATTGVLVWGPSDGSRTQRLVLLDDWVPVPGRRDPSDARAELALRFLRSHGPATVADLARWAGITLTDARAGTAAVRDRLETLDVDGTEHHMDPATPARLAAAGRTARGLLLLPGFDELVLGYADRSATVPPEHAEQLAPGRNGVFRSTVVTGGRVVGTWRRDGTAEPFTSWPRGVAARLPAARARLPS
jgi:hypothetical protein